jgi:group I intron endonuclease
MGIIYLLTSPKFCYVGQTIRTLEIRLKEHILSAYLYSDSCPRLCEAIREYGIENFTVEEIEECENELLNEREIYWIAEFECLYPNGYNMTKGGSGWATSLEAREKIVQAHRKYTDYKLPMYVSMYKKGYWEGFRVIKPNCEPVILCSSEMTMEEKYELAIEVYSMSESEISEFNKQRMANNISKRRNKLPNEFPEVQYLTYVPPPYEGFTVRHPNLPERKFANSKNSLDEKYALALEYLEHLKSGGGPEISKRIYNNIELPEYMQYCAKINGVIVKKPGHRTREFGSKIKPFEYNFQRAKAYLDNLN